MIAGFENHGGRTYLGDGAEPLGRVLEGHGNNGRDGFEGVRQPNIIGTYLHGPLLPKNAWLADHLIGARAGAPRRARSQSSRRSTMRSSARPTNRREPRPGRRGETPPRSRSAPSASGRTEAAARRGRLLPALDLDRLGLGERRHQELGDPVAGRDLEALGGRC